MELQRIATKHLHTPNTEQMSKIGGMATAALKKEAKKAEAEISWPCLLAVFGGLAVPPFFSSQEQELELGLSQLSVPGNWKLSSGALFVLLILGPWARGRYIILKSPCVGRNMSRNIPRKALRLRQQASDRKTQLRAEKR